MSYKRRGMHLTGYVKDSKDTHANFFRNILKETELDENTFDVWKNKLQTQLPAFWEDMRSK